MAVVTWFELCELSLGAKFQWLVSILGMVGEWVYPNDGG